MYTLYCNVAIETYKGLMKPLYIRSYLLQLLIKVYEGKVNVTNVCALINIGTRTVVGVQSETNLENRM